MRHRNRNRDRTMTSETTPVHPGGLTAAESLAFFRAHGIKGVPVKCRSRSQVTRTYTCLSQYLDGTVAPATHTIRALPEQHVAL